jgi:hypothetical protein
LFSRCLSGKPAQAGTAVLVAREDAQEFRLSAGVVHHLFNGQVQVGPIVHVKLLLDDREISRLSIKVLAQTTEQQWNRAALFAFLGSHAMSSGEERSTVTTCHHLTNCSRGLAKLNAPSLKTIPPVHCLIVLRIPAILE